MITAKEERSWYTEVQTMTIEELADVLRRPLTCPEAKQVIRDELLIRSCCFKLVQEKKE